MKYSIRFIAMAITFTLAISSHAAFQDPPTTPNNPDKPLYHATGNEATILGTINVSGNVPTSRKIDMSADPVCIELNNDLAAEQIVTNGQSLQNVFVYVKQGEALNSYDFGTPDSEAVLEHKGCRFSPHILGLRVGQTLSIVNGDPTTHNTHPTPRSNPEWNQTMPSGVPPITKTFRHAEVLIPFKDNQHPWERAYVGVMSHPFFAVSDEQGNYAIRGLPPGKYKLVFWHEKLGEQEVELTVVAAESRRLDMTFDTSPAFAPPLR